MRRAIGAQDFFVNQRLTRRSASRQINGLAATDAPSLTTLWPSLLARCTSTAPHTKAGYSASGGISAALAGSGCLSDQLRLGGKRRWVSTNLWARATKQRARPFGRALA